MKYINKINSILFLSFLLFSACEDYLDLSPELDISEGDVFNNYESAQGYLDNCYRALQDITNWNGQNLQRAHVSTFGDEAGYTYRDLTTSINNILNPGQWLDQPSSAEVGYNNDGLGNSKGRVISNAYYGIRVANKILVNVPNMTNITQAEKNELIGQAYFFRAWYYFDIIKRWGGMPILDKPYVSDDDLDLPRLTYQESTEWLISDLDSAFKLLPHYWADAKTGRATKVAAKAVKSMATLYAASPLMQNNTSKTTKQDYNLEWCELAAEYAMDVIHYIDANTPEKQMKGEGMTAEQQKEHYKHIFYHYPNFVSDESLWYLNSAGVNRNVSISIHFQNSRFSNRAGNWGYAVSTPSDNLASKFEMADGTPFDWNNPAHASDPFSNRDPRFDNNFLYPGKPYGVDNLGDTLYLETWVGGADDNTDIQKIVPTGYMCTKWWWPEANGYNTAAYGQYYYNTVYIRTAQIWLDYAEAMNEAYGPNSDPKGYGFTAVEAINKVRNRVGMVDVRSEFTDSKENFRERIRNERAVELMWENHRWFDIRRWMIAEDVLSGTYPIKGLNVELISGTGPADWEFSLSRKDVTTEIRVFENKHYWYPVAYDHTTQLGNFTQNPGW